QCSSASSVAPAACKVSTAWATSGKVDAPVERMTGLPVPATLRSRGTLVMSAEAILKNGTSGFRKSTAPRSNGVDEKSMPTSAQKRASASYSAAPKRSYFLNNWYWLGVASFDVSQ